MRQKRIKGVDAEYLQQMGVKTDITALNLKNNHQLYVEVGSGKGHFITNLAKDHPEIQFVAIEKIDSVCYRIAQKKNEMKLDNLEIILGDAENLEIFFKKESIDHIFLNFIDPWPKARHHKRRLTYSTYLSKYQQLLKKDGRIQLRTDHLDLFNDSIEYIEEVFDIVSEDRNLSESSYMTEYEIKKRKTGPIYQLVAKMKVE
ncbi:MAG: tRNA (guanosine(46)-N7)-methyltransferase TrmB [Candidatus Phytoplasma sp.]|nr:tRNA (guanosine(46)-N7)-methyltransferase TrmB [Phytoplasma sp.]